MRAPGGALRHPATLSLTTRILLAFALVTLALGLLPGAASGQRPPELGGRVTEAGGRPIEGAHLELVEAAADALTDAAGRYRFRVVSAGRYTLRVTRIGYRDHVASVELESGRTHLLDVELVPLAVPVGSLEVAVARDPAGGILVDREAIAGSGARSAGDVVMTVPGVVVRSTGPGAPQTVSVRGSAPDAVLVLVDGVALNDPVTGEADLSTIPADGIESVTVLPGAWTARYGPRAGAGVILIETRGEEAERAVHGSVGSLGTRSGSLVWGGSRPAAWGAGASWSMLDGAFDFELPPEVGGGAGRRLNADARTIDLWAGGASALGGGTLRLRGSISGTERGLPGRGYAPSPHARQDVERLQASANWRRIGGMGAVRASAAGARHEARFHDRAPPFGLPYDDTTRVYTLDLRLDAERQRPAAGGGLGIGYGGGVDGRWQRVEAGSLDEAAAPERVDGGVFGHLGLSRDLAGGLATFTTQLRTDRDPTADGWRLNRSLMLSFARGGWHGHVANRSSFTPPSLGDQYFRDAIGIEPNPNLRAERVPSELEAGVRAERELGSLRGTLGVTLYQGDVRDMIVWSPDYRFIWSPRNIDVKRRGAELTAELDALRGRLHLGFAHAYARVTYDRPGSGDDVQVIYRPRQTASVRAAWRDAGWRVDAEARYTGVRYPVAATLNALPAFWTVSAAVSRQFQVGGWALTPSLRADRLFDEDDSLIFGFPEPGRVLRLDVSLRPSSRPHPTLPEIDR